MHRGGLLGDSPLSGCGRRVLRSHNWGQVSSEDPGLTFPCCPLCSHNETHRQPGQNRGLPDLKGNLSAVSLPRTHTSSVHTAGRHGVPRPCLRPRQPGAVGRQCLTPAQQVPSRPGGLNTAAGVLAPDVQHSGPRGRGGGWRRAWQGWGCSQPNSAHTPRVSWEGCHHPYPLLATALRWVAGWRWGSRTESQDFWLKSMLGTPPLGCTGKGRQPKLFLSQNNRGSRQGWGDR